jgi:hypothetical protein
MRILSSRVPKSAHGIVAPLVRSIFDQPDAASVWAARPHRRAAVWPVRRRRRPEPDAALALTQDALAALHERGDKSTNLLYNALVEALVEAHVAADQPDGAHAELEMLRTDLEARNVRPAVLSDIAERASDVG